MKLRPTLQWFADMMELRLRRYDKERGRAGWRTATIEHLQQRINQARKDLDRAIREVRPEPVIVAHAADVANLAMMLADVRRRDGF